MKVAQAVQRLCNIATGANLMWEHATSNLNLCGALPSTYVIMY